MNLRRFIYAFIPPILLFAVPVLAATGTLTCSVSPTCIFGGVTIIRMSATSNAHAELSSQANYSQRLCCLGVPGLSNSCAGTHVNAINLSSVTNAHAEQGSLSGFANNVCLSVPSSGAVYVGFQDNNCTGYDTTLASISASTNATIGNSSAYARKICATAFNGSLTADVVDAGGTTVSSPAVSLSTVVPSYSCDAATGTLGTSTEKIRVRNLTSTPQWTLSIAATSGPTSSWSSGGSNYDFNDFGGCSDSTLTNDADALGGQLTFNPAAATVTPNSTCDNTGVTLGSSAAFVQGVTDSVTLVSASASAGIGCLWDLTGVGVSQDIPVEQPVGTYTMNFTLTVVAS